MTTIQAAAEQYVREARQAGVILKLAEPDEGYWEDVRAADWSAYERARVSANLAGVRGQHVAAILRGED